MEAAFQSGIASATLQLLVEKFTNFVSKEINTILGADNGLRKLQRTLLRIQGLLDYVDDGRLRFLNDNSKKAWKMWIEDLNKLCYDADDLLDELSFKLPDFNGTDQISADQVRDLLSSPLNVVEPHRIEQICSKLEAMAAEMNSLFMNEMVKFEGSKSMVEKVPYRCDTDDKNNTSSLVDEDLIVGRNDEKQQIINITLSHRDVYEKQIVDVIPITGMSGIGKSTLAQVVYNSPEMKMHFEVRMWVPVSVKFDLVRISKAILESARNRSCGLSNLDLIQSEIQIFLARKRFLLVLDDFWSEKHGDWEALSAPFRYSDRGSKIIVTTRSARVSSVVGTVPAHHLKMLSREDCWKIMRQWAFSSGSINMNENLEQLGMAIAAKCNGLPLAAKTIGSVLHSKYNYEGWRSILESEFWDLPLEKNAVVSSLALSYYYLPAHLKKCFTYCSIFPPGHEFDIDDLVLRWMAEGFLEPVGKRNLEEIGRDYFMDLLDMSLFLCAEGDLNDPRKCKMHDLIHSMAKSVSDGLCFQMEDDISYWYPLYRNVRHLSLSHQSMESIAQTVFPKYQSLRTFMLMCRSGNGIRSVSFDLLLKFRSLRVLDLSNARIEELPESIDQLRHLRYLNLSKNPIRILPRRITKLLCLQTLNLSNCNQLLKLPSDLMDLTNLRHPVFNRWHSLNCMPPNLGRLTNLQTLGAFIVGSDEGCGIRELEKMSFLKASLRLTRLENVPNLTEAKKASLDEKPFLDKLELVWSNGHNCTNQEEALEGLQPHLNVRELGIINYSGNVFPSWLSEPERKFTSIRMQGCRSCSVLPPFGRLPLLKSLDIGSTSSLVAINHGFCALDNSLGFPSLESLTFKDMPEWIEWNGFGENDMPCLHNLTIEGCPKLLRLPILHSLRSLQTLKIISCSSLQSMPDELPHSLRQLIISDIANLREWDGLGGNQLPCLRGLTIGKCPSLISLPSLHNLFSLEELKIIGCPNLHALPEELPDSLVNLIILESNIIKERCRMGDGEDWPKIRTIQKIVIDGVEIQVQDQGV